MVGKAQCRTYKITIVTVYMAAILFVGGFAFVQANLHHGAVPLVMRDIDSKFTSYLIVGGDSSAKDITDFKWKRIALN